MTCCLNPKCSKPINPDEARVCQNCNQPLTHALRRRYKPIRVLGHGGFGRTYLALDRDRLDAYSVIKQFSPQAQGTKTIDKAIQLFNQEALRLYDLGEHPQIPTLLAYFEENQYLYLVQQYIEGRNLLEELNQEGPFDESKIREIFLSLLPVIQYIHDRQVIHRDITPTNILRQQRDQKLMLIDFGVAKQLTAHVSEQSGTRIGTEGYSPLEQFRGGKAYPASDIYSLGATAIHLLTKIKPEQLYDPLSGDWIWRQRLADQGRYVSDQLADILNRMLKDLVNERYQSAHEVLKDLTQPSSTWQSASPEPHRSQQAPLNPIPSSQSPARKPISKRISRSPHSSEPRSQPRTSQQRVSKNQQSNRQKFSSSQSSTSRSTTSQQPTTRPIVSNVPTVHTGSYHTKYCRCVYTIAGHTSWVTDLALSPITNTFATSSLDDTVKLWNLNTGELLKTLRGHDRGVNVVIFSPSGRWVISGSDDHTIKIWDSYSGELVRTLSAHLRDVTALTVSPDGQFLISGGEDRSIRVWELKTGKLVKSPLGVVSMVKALAMSPNQQLFASGGLDKVIRLWSMQTAERISEITGHSGAIQSIVISPNSQVLASASKDRTIRLWNISDGSELHILKGHSRDINCVAITPDGRFLLSASSDKTIRIWDIATGIHIDTLTDHLDAVNAIAIYSDKKTFVTCSSDKTIKVWRMRTRS